MKELLYFGAGLIVGFVAYKYMVDKETPAQIQTDLTKIIKPPLTTMPISPAAPTEQVQMVSPAM
jgi:hypothetical protein